jgi:hypothetical protein
MKPYTGGFVILLGHLEGLLWTRDQPVAKASTHTTEKHKDKHPSLERDSIPVTKRTRSTAQTARPPEPAQIKIHNIIIYLLFYMAVKLGHSH